MQYYNVILGSNPTPGIYVCVFFLCLCWLVYVELFLVQRVQPDVYKQYSYTHKKGGPELHCSVVPP